MFDLRYYQEELISGAHTAWENHQSTAIISATGTGKTEMYMALAAAEPGRVLVIVHRDYLITQPIQRLESAGFHDIGIEKAEQRSEVGLHKAKIVFASVQSIGPESQAKRLKSFDPFKFSLVIIDEGHRATSPTYRRCIDHFRANTKCKILILTATPNRKDGVALRNVCDSVAGVYGPSSAMNEGWIVPVKFFRRDVQSLDFSNVRLKGSDLDPDQVQQLLLQEKPLHEVCASLAEDRGPTLVFCPEVAIGQAYTQLMNERYRPGRARFLFAESDDDERDRCGKMLAQGEIDYIFNVNLYTEGYDLPNLLRVVWASPTASLVRYTQGVGRVFRTHPSLRGYLTGSREEAKARRLLIEQSPKPFGIVVTYYGVNCKHELCDPVDILGGDDLPGDVKTAAKMVQSETSKLGGGSATDEDIETAKIFCELRLAVASARKELKAKASYSDSQFDPMSGRKIIGDARTAADVKSASASNDWPTGEPATDKQLKWFQWKRIPVPPNITKWRAIVVRNLIDMGVKPITALSYSKRQALAVEASIKSKQQGGEEDIPQ